MLITVAAVGITLGVKTLVGLIVGSSAVGAGVAGTVVYLTKNSPETDQEAINLELAQLNEEAQSRHAQRLDSLISLQEEMTTSIHEVMTQTKNTHDQLQINPLEAINMTLQEEAITLAESTTQLTQAMAVEKETFNTLVILLHTRTQQLAQLSEDFENQKQELMVNKQDLAITLTQLSATQTQLDHTINHLNQVKQAVESMTEVTRQENNTLKENEKKLREHVAASQEKITELSQKMALLTATTAEKMTDYKNTITLLTAQDASRAPKSTPLTFF